MHENESDHEREYGEFSCAGRNPKCWPLLDDPMAILADRSRWPTHLCYGLLKKAIERWSISRLDDVFNGTIHQAYDVFCDALPLAIGTQSVSEYLEEYEDLDGLTRIQLSSFAIFSDRELALFPLRIEVNGTQIDILGLAKRDTVDAAWSSLGEIKFQITGYPDDPDVLRIVSSTQRWWKTLLKLRIPSGRPANSRRWNLDRIGLLLTAYARVTGDVKPSQRRFFDWLHLVYQQTPTLRPSERTLEKLLAEGSTTWKQWRESILY